MKLSKNIKHYHSQARNFLNYGFSTLIRRTFNSYHLVTITIVAIFTLLSLSKAVLADNLNSPSFDIKMGTINITGGSKSSASYKLNDTVGQTAQGEFNSGGYTIKAGFQYVLNNIPFTFTISDIDLDYGSLVPGTPSTLTNILGLTTGSAYGYSIKVIEDHSLKLTNGTDTIPDTACDLASPCTITDATPWTVNTRYGFGYNVNSTDADPEFAGATYYRPFPIQVTDQPSLVMSKATAAATASGIVTYKINVSGSQAAGTYQNGLQFIAIPSF